MLTETTIDKNTRYFKLKDYEDSYVKYEDVIRLVLPVVENINELNNVVKKANDIFEKIFGKPNTQKDLDLRQVLETLRERKNLLEEEYISSYTEIYNNKNYKK